LAPINRLVKGLCEKCYAAAYREEHRLRRIEEQLRRNRDYKNRRSVIEKTATAFTTKDTKDTKDGQVRSERERI